MAQFSGAMAGACIARYLLRATIGRDAIRYAVTAPGIRGSVVAFIAELTISFVLMTTVLVASNRERLARLTPYFVGLLYAIFITLEAPLSGMSMNPARSFAPALHESYWHALWLYFTRQPWECSSPPRCFCALAVEFAPSAQNCTMPTISDASSSMEHRRHSAKPMGREKIENANRREDFRSRTH
jgi:hypothetical protein